MKYSDVMTWCAVAVWKILGFVIVAVNIKQIYRFFPLHFLSDLQLNILCKLNIFALLAMHVNHSCLCILEGERAVGIRINVHFEGKIIEELRKTLTIRIYTLGLKSSFALTCIKMSCRCFFTGRATVVLLLQENKVRVLTGKTHNSF